MVLGPDQKQKMSDKMIMKNLLVPFFQKNFNIFIVFDNLDIITKRIKKDISKQYEEDKKFGTGGVLNNLGNGCDFIQFEGFYHNNHPKRKNTKIKIKTIIELIKNRNLVIFAGNFNLDKNGQKVYKIFGLTLKDIMENPNVLLSYVDKEQAKESKYFGDFFHTNYWNGTLLYTCNSEGNFIDLNGQKTTQLRDFFIEGIKKMQRDRDEYNLSNEDLYKLLEEKKEELKEE